jgi:hypothetical protein
MIRFFLSELVDDLVRQNFRKLDAYLRDEPFRKGGFRFVERSLDKESAAATFPALVAFQHQLGFQPKDVILTSVSPDTVTVTPKYDSFTRTTVTFEISAPCTVRAYIGRYEETR